MKVLSHHQIDKRLWNSKLLQFSSDSIPPYGYAEYLDIVNPGWVAIWDEVAESYMPITIGGIFKNKVVSLG